MIRQVGLEPQVPNVFMATSGGSIGQTGPNNDPGLSTEQIATLRNRIYSAIKKTTSRILNGSHAHSTPLRKQLNSTLKSIALIVSNRDGGKIETGEEIYSAVLKYLDLNEANPGHVEKEFHHFILGDPRRTKAILKASPLKCNLLEVLPEAEGSSRGTLPQKRDPNAFKHRPEAQRTKMH